MRKFMLLLLGFGGSAVMALLLIHNTAQGLALSAEPLSWPRPVEQTPIKVLGVISYSGLYHEDGSGDPVVHVAAVILENCGPTTVRNGAVKLRQGERILVFSFTMLPPGGKVLVAEKSRLPYSDMPISGCWGWTLELMTPRQIHIEEYGRSGMTVTNLSDAVLEQASVQYKFYDPMQGLFIGGYTYQVAVKDLKPGIPRVVPVYRYIAGSCKIVE